MLNANKLGLMLGVSVVLAAALLAAAGVAQAGKDNIRIEYVLANAGVSLGAAIGRVEEQLGGRVLEVELERERGRFVYEVELIKDEIATEVEVDLDSGDILSSRRERFSRDERRALAALRGAGLSLTQAVENAEQQTAGKAKGVELEEEDGVIWIEVELVRNGKEYEVIIDLATGQVLWTDRDD